MSHSLVFAQEFSYPARESGIDLPVSLRFGDRTVDLNAKVDTGAPYCVFRKQYGERLGLDVESGEQLALSSASGDTFLTFGHEVTIEVCGYAFDSTVYFARDPGFQRSVLGRAGWLNQLRVAIIDHDCLLYASRYGE